MQFAHTYQKVLDGSKTQTRRLVKPGEAMDSFGCVWRWKDPESQNRVISVYTLGKDYAVCPGRGKAQVARIEITNIRREDVRNISDEDVKAEGFTDKFEFMRVWISMHDKEMHKQQYWGLESIKVRPAERYTAWAVTFALVK